MKTTFIHAQRKKTTTHTCIENETLQRYTTL